MVKHLVWCQPSGSTSNVSYYYCTLLLLENQERLVPRKCHGAKPSLCSSTDSVMYLNIDVVTLLYPEK